MEEPIANAEENENDNRSGELPGEVNALRNEVAGVTTQMEAMQNQLLEMGELLRDIAQRERPLSRQSGFRPISRQSVHSPHANNARTPLIHIPNSLGGRDSRMRSPRDLFNENERSPNGRSFDNESQALSKASFKSILASLFPFTGLGDSNPQDFVASFEEALYGIPLPESEKIKLFKSLVRTTDRTWDSGLRISSSRYEEYRAAFLRRFFSEGAQERLYDQFVSAVPKSGKISDILEFVTLWYGRLSALTIRGLTPKKVFKELNSKLPSSADPILQGQNFETLDDYLTTASAVLKGLERKNFKFYYKGGYGAKDRQNEVKGPNNKNNFFNQAPLNQVYESEGYQGQEIPVTNCQQQCSKNLGITGQGPRRYNKKGTGKNNGAAEQRNAGSTSQNQGN